MDRINSLPLDTRYAGTLAGQSGTFALPAPSIVPLRGVIVQNDAGSGNALVIDGGLSLAAGDKEFFPINHPEKLALTSTGCTVNYWGV